MNLRSRWWDIAVVGACLVTTAIAFLDERPDPLSPLVPIGLGLIVLAHVTFGSRALREENCARGRVYAIVIIIGIGIGMAGSGTVAIAQTALYPVLWALSATWRLGVLRTLAMGAALVLGAGLGRQDWAESSITAGLSILFSVAIGTWIVRIAENVEERDALLTQLRQAQEDVAILERAAGVEQERARVAREIHDTIAQSLTGLVMVVQRTRGDLETDPGASAQNLEVIGDLAQDALREARALVADYARPAALADSLERVTASFARETGVDVELVIEVADLDREHEVVLLRTVQEALANVRKHARATQVRIRLEATDPDGGDAVGTWLEVADDGVGPTPGAPSGYGLRGLEDRLALVGGWISFGPGSPRGSLLRAHVPRSPHGAEITAPAPVTA